MARSGLCAVFAGDVAGPAGVARAVGESERQCQPTGDSNCVSIACRFADPVAIADRFAYAIADPDGIAFSLPELVADAGSVSDLADRRIPPRRDGRRERERQNCAGA